MNIGLIYFILYSANDE